jgi:hypothetical protein
MESRRISSSQNFWFQIFGSVVAEGNEPDALWTPIWCTNWLLRQLWCLPELLVLFSLWSLTFFPWRWGGSSTLAWMPTYVSILRIPQMIWLWRATVEWYWQGKTEELVEKPVPVPLFPPQIPYGLTRARTRASAVRGRRLTTWAMARSHFVLRTNSLSRP